MTIIPDLETAIVLAIPFVITFLALHLILFRPLFDYLEERQDASVTARREAGELSGQIEQRVATLDQKLATARDEVAALRAAARAKAHEEEARIVAEARQAADADLTEAIGRIRTSQEAAARSLRETSASLSRDIASTVLGRPVQEAG